MKVIRKGKEYDYDYKQILMYGKYYRALKKVADKENLPLGRMIGKLVEHYESCIRK